MTAVSNAGPGNNNYYNAILKHLKDRRVNVDEAKKKKIEEAAKDGKLTSQERKDLGLNSGNGLFDAYARGGKLASEVQAGEIIAGADELSLEEMEMLERDVEDFASVFGYSKERAWELYLKSNLGRIDLEEAKKTGEEYKSEYQAYAPPARGEKSYRLFLVQQKKVAETSVVLERLPSNANGVSGTQHVLRFAYEKGETDFSKGSIDKKLKEYNPRTAEQPAPPLPAPPPVVVAPRRVDARTVEPPKIKPRAEAKPPSREENPVEAFSRAVKTGRQILGALKLPTLDGVRARLKEIAKTAPTPALVRVPAPVAAPLPPDVLRGSDSETRRELPVRAEPEGKKEGTTLDGKEALMRRLARMGVLAPLGKRSAGADQLMASGGAEKDAYNGTGGLTVSSSNPGLQGKGAKGSGRAARIGSLGRRVGGPGEVRTPDRKAADPTVPRARTRGEKTQLDLVSQEIDQRASKLLNKKIISAFSRQRNAEKRDWKGKHLYKGVYIPAEGVVEFKYVGTMDLTKMGSPYSMQNDNLPKTVRVNSFTPENGKPRMRVTDVPVKI